MAGSVRRPFFRWSVRSGQTAWRLAHWSAAMKTLRSESEHDGPPESGAVQELRLDTQMIELLGQ